MKIAIMLIAVSTFFAGAGIERSSLSADCPFANTPLCPKNLSAQTAHASFTEAPDNCPFEGTPLCPYGETKKANCCAKK